MAKRHNVSSTLSADIVLYLIDRGHTQAAIARMLGVTEGFISLVKSRDRSLTLDHLELLTESLSIPLGALLLAVTEPKPPAKLDPDHKRLLDLTAQILEKADHARRAILHTTPTPSR